MECSPFLDSLSLKLPALGYSSAQENILDFGPGTVYQNLYYLEISLSILTNPTQFLNRDVISNFNHKIKMNFAFVSEV